MQQLQQLRRMRRMWWLRGLIPCFPQQGMKGLNHMACQKQWMFMPRILLQFHITGRCNLRCKHCYRMEGDVERLSHEDVLTVFHQYEELRRSFNQARGSRRRGHINLTGGEPFMRRDMPELLQYLGAHRQEYSYGILSNGSMIGQDMIRLLKETGVSFVQLSIDGKPETHNQLRAPGDYQRTMKKAAELEQNGISTHISFTANRGNMADLPLVARACRMKRITRLWSDRLVPIGNGADLGELTIGKEQLPQYLKYLKQARGSKWKRLIWPHTEVRMARALQCLGGGENYHCSAGDTLIVVDEMGQIMPCRRMPILCGDIYTTTLSDVYFSHPVFTSLRSCDIPEACIHCAHYFACQGGAKCQSYAYYGDFTHADPGCPLAMPEK